MQAPKTIGFGDEDGILRAISETNENMKLAAELLQEAALTASGS
jgi:hypothetical protein